MWRKLTFSHLTEEITQQLQHYSLVPVSVIESEGKFELFGDFPELPAEYLPISEEIDAEINWQEQWDQHAGGFHEGVSSYTLPTGETIQLKPGGGFGDFSHPTTLLMLELMTAYVPDKTCVDLGSGSGVLTVAALEMGAKQVYAIDIDPHAVAHTKENIALSSRAASALAAEKAAEIADKPFDLLLLNMIKSEQKVALSRAPWLEKADIAIVSGIRIEEEAEYLAECQKRSWEPLLLHTLGEWLGIVFKRS